MYSSQQSPPKERIDWKKAWETTERNLEKSFKVRRREKIQCVIAKHNDQQSKQIMYVRHIHSKEEENDVIAIATNSHLRTSLFRIQMYVF